MEKAISHPQKFFAELGGLHDADITQMSWNPTARLFKIDIDDLNANFDGLPGYQGKKPATLAFAEIENLSVNCDAALEDTQRIYKLEVEERASGRFAMSLRISPSGRVGFDFTIASVHVPN